MSDLLLIEHTPPITWLTLNRPQSMNSLNRELLKVLVKACGELSNSRDTTVVALTGSGAKAFCAGADLAERKEMSEGEVLDYLALIQRTMLAIEALPQVVIAAINGPAFGGGTELALACDLRVMAEGASLRLTEVKLGIIPGAGGTQRLPRLIGKSRAKELILTARALPASEALAIGLAHRLVATDPGDPHRELKAVINDWAKEIASGAPLALSRAKQAIDAGYDRDLSAGLAIETRAYLELINTRDRLEGLKAFAERRSPVYRGE